MICSVRTVAKQANLIIYGVIVTILTILAVMDVTQILKDYLYDNTFTLIKLENVNGTLPFMDNPTVCALYGDPSIFPELWNMSLKEQNQKRDWKSWYARVSSNDSRLFGPVAPGKFTSQERIDVTLFSEMILELEFDGVHYFNDNFIKATHLNKTEVNRVVDKFLSNPFSKAIMDKAGEEARKTVVNTYEIHIPEFILDNLTFEFACYTIRLDEYLTQDAKRDFEIGALRDTNNGSTFVTPVNLVTVDFPDFGIKYDGQIDKIPPTISIRISNTGRLDGSLVRPCTALFKTESECLEDLQWRTTSEVCGCTPFSYLRFMDKNRNLAPNKHLPICTTSIYEGCYDLAVEEWKRRKLDAHCQPCVMSKNKYIDIYETPDPTSRRGLTVSFQCTDSFYVVFQEKNQFSFPQLVSQIGGDLGLYIGFSMVSFVHFAAACYHIYQSRRVSDEGAPRRKAWSQLIARQIRSIRHHQQDAHTNEVIRQLEQRVKALENSLKAFEKKHTDVRAEAWRSRQVLQRLDVQLTADDHTRPEIPFRVKNKAEMTDLD